MLKFINICARKFANSEIVDFHGFKRPVRTLAGCFRRCDEVQLGETGLAVGADEDYDAVGEREFDATFSRSLTSHVYIHFVSVTLT